MTHLPNRQYRVRNRIPVRKGLTDLRQAWLDECLPDPRDRDRAITVHKRGDFFVATVSLRGMAARGFSMNRGDSISKARLMAGRI